MKIKKIKSPEMAGKRSATTDLNHDNWDKEEQPEDKGVFKVASSEELQNRVIKKAKRKLTGDNNSGSEDKKEIFSGFTGFSKTASNATTVSGSASPFSFLSKLTPSSTSSEEKLETKKDEPKKELSNNFQFEKSNTYFAKLKGLNQAVSSWIKKHVDENPLCILTPIFQDYDKYLKEIEKDKEQASSKAATTQFTFGSSSSANGSDKAAIPEGKKSGQNLIKFTSSSPQTKPSSSTITAESGSEAASTKSTVTSAPLFSFSKSDTGAASSTTAATFSFGQKSENSTVTSTSPPAFSFGKKPEEKAAATEITKVSTAPAFAFKPASTAATSTTGFSFSGSKPFTFGASVSKPEGSGETPKEEEEDYQPPKAEFQPVVEEDSVYSKKCKVFIKQGASYTDHGVGTLYLKPIKDKGKTQLIVRADTSLGNISLNFILNESIPTQRMGKNNVMMVCIPTPESEQKPTPILLRVKTGEEADELLETINKYKK